MNEIVFYELAGDAIEVRVENETVWLSQEQMANLFDRERSVITKHLRNVFKDGELDEAAVCANFAHTAADGKTYQTRHFNLDAILSVGYRVNSKRGVQFRQWASRVLKDYLVRAAHLLYFVIKNHPLSDGNKRIGSLLFVDFLHRNGRLLRDGQPVVNDVGLAALALLVAESRPADKDVLIRLIMNMLAGDTA